MSLDLSTRLGPYEIQSAIGARGMGEVYCARDTKLDRDVAIEILPDAFAHDAERVARFQREAKTLAALNHPNIGGIYGLEEASGITALVLELVERPSLAERLGENFATLSFAQQESPRAARAFPVMRNWRWNAGGNDDKTVSTRSQFECRCAAE